MKYTKNTHKENKKENQKKKKIIFQNIGYFWNLLFNFIFSSRIKIHIFVFLFHIVEIIHSCFRPRQRLPWIAAKSLNFLLVYDKWMLWCVVWKFTNSYYWKHLVGTDKFYLCKTTKSPTNFSRTIRKGSHPLNLFLVSHGN